MSDGQEATQITAYDKTYARSAIRKTREAIETALELIRNHEDGPFTMTMAIRDIDSQVDSIDTEIGILIGTLEQATEVILRYRTRYEEALRQRDAVLQILQQPIE
jgi:hypothetical protein